MPVGGKIPTITRMLSKHLGQDHRSDPKRHQRPECIRSTERHPVAPVSKHQKQQEHHQTADQAPSSPITEKTLSV